MSSQPARDLFQVGWICALPVEAAAAKEMLDENFGILNEQDIADTNSYTLGRIGNHYIAIASLPDGQYGTTSATTVAINMLRTFSTSLRIGLMVGIGGGIPTGIHDIRLGDIVVSRPHGSCGGVIQHDMEKLEKHGTIKRIGSLNSPPRSLLVAVGNLRATEMTDDLEYTEYIEKAIGRNRKTLKLFARPESKRDRLFKPEYYHPDSSATCHACAAEWEDTREERDDQIPRIHYGIIASGNSLIKDSATRDRIYQETGALCCEMEAAGLMQDFPCIIIRGICDYCDSHKNDDWQGYAALAAASYAKELLKYVPRGQVPQEGLAAGLSEIKEDVNELQKVVSSVSGNLDLQSLLVAPGAAFDSYENPHDECLLGTRTEILDQIDTWVLAPCDQRMFWLKGMAGTGKSTIARTVSSRLQTRNALGASFFFRRGETDRGSAKRLFPTLASQLARSMPETLPFLQKMIKDTPDISEKGLADQFKNLILESILSLDKIKTSLKIITIDALDECERTEDISLILSLLAQAQRLISHRIRFFITSRPELPTRQGFKKIEDHHLNLALHEIPIPVIRKDITLYFHHQFSKLRKESERELPPDWPGDDAMNRLIERAIPLFISAATLCRFIGDQNWDCRRRLKAILSDHTSYVSKMDSTYMPILNQLLEGQEQDETQVLIQEFKKIVGIIVVLAAPQPLVVLSRLLDLPIDDVACRLDRLHSVLDVPASLNKPIRTLHQSFPEFLLHPKQKDKSPFWVDKSEMHQRAARRSFELMGSLQKNICNLPSYGTLFSDIDIHTVSLHLPQELQYCCRYWAHHLVQCIGMVDLRNEALMFLQTHYLHWVEAMALFGLASEVIEILNDLELNLAEYRDSAILSFVYDAKRFILKNREIVQVAPLQLYSSGLLFAPSQSTFSKTFENEIPSWVDKPPLAEQNWSAELQALEGSSRSLSSAVFSPDGRLIAVSGFSDPIILYEAVTGKLHLTLKSPGRSGWHKHSTFSPDSKLLASASDDKTICLWDTTTGDATFITGTSVDRNCPLVFTDAESNDQVLASGSLNGTVDLWQVSTGVLRQTIMCHSEPVNFFAISPERKLMVSSSRNELKFWNMETGKLRVAVALNAWCMAVSRDSQLLASGVRDHNLHIWEASSGKLLRTMSDDTKDVRALAFSPDGELLATSSRYTVQLWHVSSGVLFQQFSGHFDFVNSVAFSPDSRILVSSSGDGTVRLWNITMTDSLQSSLHTNYMSPVRSVSFAPNGLILASTNDFDNSAHLWDTGSRSMMHSLEGHSGPVLLTAFSHNSQLLATAAGNGDQMTRLWDTQKGALRHSLHCGGCPGVVEFSPDDSIIVLALEMTLQLWDVAEGSHLYTLLSDAKDFFPGASIHTVAFSPSGRLLACSPDRGHNVQLWDTSTGTFMTRLQGHSNSIYALAFSPDGNHIASGSNDCKVRVWRIDMPSNAKLQLVIEEDSNSVNSVAFSFDSRRLATTRISGMHIYDVETGVLQQRLTNPEDQASVGTLGRITFSSDNEFLNSKKGRFSILDSAARSSVDIILNISVRGEWVKLNNRKELWLPADYRPTRSGLSRHNPPASWTTFGNTLAIGHNLGWVSFITFDL